MGVTLWYVVLGLWATWFVYRKAVRRDTRD